MALTKSSLFRYQLINVCHSNIAFLAVRGVLRFSSRDGHTNYLRSILIPSILKYCID